jgi:cob(I)alamin adenosyltransferase
MKIYTRTGDRGETALFGGGRVLKDHRRVEAYGAVDELNAYLGRAVALTSDPEIAVGLGKIQHDLFAVGAILATPPSGGPVRHASLPPLPETRIAEMEAWMDRADEELTPLRTFILPGGCIAAAELHVARTVCRRAERQVVPLIPEDSECALVIQYLNRLSDLLFTLARLENHRAGVEDVAWQKEAPAGGSA